MKLQRRQLSKGKLSSAVRDLLIFMPRKKLSLSMLSVGSAVVAKCRELWEGLTGGGLAVADDDYFRGSYEFSCSTRPINFLATTTKNGRGRRRRRRRRRLPPCVGGNQAQEMLACMAPAGKGWSPDRSPFAGAGAGNEIDGRAEEFIRRFYDEQLKMQMLDMGSASPGALFVPVI